MRLYLFFCLVVSVIDRRAIISNAYRAYVYFYDTQGMIALVYKQIIFGLLIVAWGRGIIYASVDQRGIFCAQSSYIFSLHTYYMQSCYENRNLLHSGAWLWTHQARVGLYFQRARNNYFSLCSSFPYLTAHDSRVSKVHYSFARLKKEFENFVRVRNNSSAC